MKENIKSSHLIIAGGALKKNKNKVFSEFLKLSGGANAKIVVVLTATMYPKEVFEEIRDDFAALGLAKESIVYLEIASEIFDDLQTEKWLNNADNPSEVQKVLDATGMWFTGGNQHRTTDCLYDEKGEDTAVLKAIKIKLKKGNFVIGGTSAGAAIMSETMIGGGTSISALTNNKSYEVINFGDSNGDELIITKGLGFLKKGVVDQHFDARDRLGRLIETTLNESQKHFGFGVSEDTALVFDTKSNIIKVLGNDGVVIVNTMDAQKIVEDGRIKFVNVDLSFINEKMQYNAQSNEFIIRDEKYEVADIQDAVKRLLEVFDKELMNFEYEKMPNTQCIYFKNLNNYGVIHLKVKISLRTL